MFYYLKKEWKWNVLALTVKILDSALAVGANVLLIALFQSVIDGNLRLFAWTAAGFMGICGVDNLVCIAVQWTSGRAKMAMNNRYRADAAATLLTKSHGEFHAQDSGEYLSWLTNDVNQISTMAWDSFYNIVAATAQVLFSAIVLTAMHWSLLVASILIALVVINVPKLGQKKMAAMGERYAQQQAKATAKLKDLLMGVDVLASFGHQKRFRRENAEASGALEMPRHRLNLAQKVFGEGVNFVSSLCTVSALLLMGYLSIRGILVQAALTGGGNLISTIASGLATDGQYWLSIQASKPYFDKITTHSGEESEQKPCVTVPVAQGITMEGISFNYGDKRVLENADFAFQKGGKYALTGPSGCGKSTVLKLILGWLPDYRGTIRFDGKNAREIPAEGLLEQISYIEQDVFLFNTTIRDNITLGGEYADTQLEKAIRGSALDGDLANMPLGLDTPVGENGSALSGGQKQRVAIARALVHNRSILLVDEGTSALDAQNADIVEKSLLGNPDLTLILVSHHLTQERKEQFTKVYELKPAAG